MSTFSINPLDFDDVEVLPVYKDKEQGFCEPVPETPHEATFWTVYGHRKEGGVTALIDCADEHSADVAASILEKALLVPELKDTLAVCGITLRDLEASRRKGYLEKARQMASAINAKANAIFKNT